VKDYLNARYVGPPESCWRLFSFDMHAKSHVVERSLASLSLSCVMFTPYVCAHAIRANRTDGIAHLLSICLGFGRLNSTRPKTCNY
jgi:hypothetical protein